MNTEATPSQQPPATPDTSAGDGSAVLSDNDKFILMARKVIWALKYLKAPGSGIMMKTDDTGRMICTPWTTDFCDALAKCGIEIDRAALDAIHSGKRTKKAKKPNSELNRSGGTTVPR